jgi:hypothetical protein
MGLALDLPSGRSMALTLGRRVSSADIPGLSAATSDGIIGEVVSHPTNPSLIGLKNLTRVVWSARMPDGSHRRVEPGRSIQIQPGVQINFGPSRAVVR